MGDSTRNFIKCFAFPGLLVALPGQIIWAIIFWNSSEAMFMHHWTVAGIGLLWMLLGACIAIWQTIN